MDTVNELTSSLLSPPLTDCCMQNVSAGAAACLANMLRSAAHGSRPGTHEPFDARGRSRSPASAFEHRLNRCCQCRCAEPARWMVTCHHGWDCCRLQMCRRCWYPFDMQSRGPHILSTQWMCGKCRCECHTVLHCQYGLHCCSQITCADRRYCGVKLLHFH